MTDFLKNGGSRETAQIAGHSEASTTDQFDCPADRIELSEAKIGIGRNERYP